MTTDVAADIRTEAPAGPQNGPKLGVHFILNGVPSSAMPNHRPDEGADNRIPFATISITHQVTPEEARAIRDTIRYAVSLVVESDDGSGQPDVNTWILSRATAEAK